MALRRIKEYTIPQQGLIFYRFSRSRRISRMPDLYR